MPPSSAPRHQDLIAFIRSLPEEQQLALTQDAPDFTLDCMRKLVDLALARAIPTVGCVPCGCREVGGGGGGEDDGWVR